MLLETVLDLPNALEKRLLASESHHDLQKSMWSIPNTLPTGALIQSPVGVSIIPWDHIFSRLTFSQVVYLKLNITYSVTVTAYAVACICSTSCPIVLIKYKKSIHFKNIVMAEFCSLIIRYVVLSDVFLTLWNSR